MKKVARYTSNEPSIDEYSECTDNKLLDFFIIDILNKLYLIQNNGESKIREKLRKKEIGKYP
ncbi:DUF6038 family protein [Staphylococcus aureus]|uniref:DUF6038 family protein n=1 Tax=Staphylococcus aureus TaxID=1280 RepID=UPI0038B284A7